MSEQRNRGGGRRSKVARVIDDYDLEGMGERLERSWLGDGEPERSLRDLADLFNRAVLESSMRSAGVGLLDGEVGNLYRLLTDEDVTAGQRAEAEARIEREGLDPDRIRSAFVSHQAVHTYLTDHRDAEFPSPDDEERLKSALDTVQAIRGRLSNVATETLSSLATTGAISLGEFDVLVSVSVYCEDCANQYDVADLLERGGCDCE
jgi:hypothetical protein